MHKGNLKKIIQYIAIGLTAGLALTSIIARLKKNNSIYKNEPSQKNPMEGKKVSFVYNEDEPENADGVRGHLEAIGNSDYKPGIYEKYVKRGIDILLSFGGLVVLSPFLLGISIAIVIDDPGPILFTQKRLGKNKEYFKLHKFRSMKMCTPHDVPTHMLENPGQYITRVGKFLRAHSLDELPQIWDIFIGNMSVIGPRPGLWNQDLLTAERDKYQANDVKPGLTGWAQINGRDELEIPDKARLDGDYVAHMGLWMDMKVFLGSLHVFGKDDSVVEGGTGEMKKEKLHVSEELVSDIVGKKILFFAPAFFDYENKISKKMKDMGAYVDMYDVRSVTSARDRALLKVFPKIFSPKSLEYYERIISENKEKDYDYILIVKCDMTPESILKKFRDIFPNAKLCLYLWDSIDNIPGVVNKFMYFDTLHSFDPRDCKKYSELKFRPLFYADEFCKEMTTENYKYDVCFAGTIHSDRYAIIRDVRKIVAEKGLKSYWFCFLQSKFIYYFYKISKKEFIDTNIKDFNFQKIDSKEIADIVDDSRIILDIQHPKQTGLTMRTIEMLGMKKKLITTNDTVKDYDFYNPNNISVVDRKNVKIDDEFLTTSYEVLSDDIYKKYALQSWILEVLS
ncbi:sugar transferase [Kineothrix sp. MSJ-39]|uniref:sugar transferase n=1 Tax=Kineothrix sp. MSJ-39 TaxID=2841533 RepID=UPI0020A01851|nr:sugar transferase [Kineothrix sp. MSJ-39]